MLKRALYPHNGYGHGPVTPPPGLKEAREKLKSQPLKCGNCRQKFSAICALHKHLNGDSYHYDKEMMTAYPLDENSCPSFNDEKVSMTGTYMTEHGPRIVSMTKHKKKNSKYIKKEPTHVPTKPDKIINIQIYPEEDDNDNIEADPANVDLEYFGSPTSPVVVAEPETSQHFDMGSQISADNDEPATGIEAVNACDVGDFDDDVLSENIKQEIKIENQILTESNEQHVHIENDGQEYVPIKEALPVVEPIPNIEAVLNVPENPESHEEMLGLQETGDALYTHDQQSTAELQPNQAEPTSFVMNKQMIIDLHSMETNEDGSLKIVVGEKDAAIFKTPQGEEILKALKTQGKGLSVKNTQIVYNYSVPISLEGDTNDELAETSIHVPAIADTSLTPVKRGLDFDEMSEQKKKRKYMRQDDIGEEMAESVDGLEAVVFMRKEDKITTAEAMAILGEVNLGMHEDKVSKIQPLKAKGGDLFVVDLEALPNRRDIRHDKYIWYNVGTRRYPKNKELMKKSVFKIRLPDQTFSDGFMKSIFEWIDEKERYCIIHYTGFEGLFKPFPHGNCKSGKNFVRTCRSVIEELKEMASQEDVSPTDVYKQVKGVTPPGLRNLRAPRNLDQIKNHFFYEKKRKLAALRKAAQKNKDGAIGKPVSEDHQPQGDEIDLSSASGIAVNVLPQTIQAVSDSHLSQGTQNAVSLLAPVIHVPDNQTQDSQQPYIMTVTIAK